MENNTENKYLIANSTKEQRKVYAVEALAISTLDAGEPTSYCKNLIQKYIDGEMELKEITEKVIEQYKQKAEK